MARLGRGIPARPVISRAPHLKAAHVTLDPWESASEWPALTVETPNAQVALDPWESASEWPTLEVHRGVGVTLDPWESASEWPALTVTTPVLPGDSMDGASGQIEFNGFLIGRGTPYRWRTLQGWRERPPVESANVPAPTGHGTLPVRPQHGQRTILFTALIRARRDEIEEAINDLEQATPTYTDERESYLVVNDLGTPYLVEARIDRIEPGPLDKYARLGHVPLVIQWVASDPRRYNVNRTGVSLPVGQTTNLPNAGNETTFPIIRLPGPVQNPALHNAALDRLLELTITLDSGERLVIDPKRKSIVVQTYADGAWGSPVLALGNLTATSVPISAFVLDRGDNPLQYTADSGGTNPGVALYRDAWL